MPDSLAHHSATDPALSWNPRAAVGPRYARVRAEGKRVRDVLPDWSGYALKYLLKNRGAAPSVLDHFAAQRHRLQALYAEPRPSGPTVRLGLVGDMMWIRRNWGGFLGDCVRHHMTGFDACLGNLETPISDRHRVPRWLPDYIRYNATPDLLRAFRRPDGTSPFAALSLANNHALDKGDVGIERTLAALEAEGVPAAGVGPRGETADYVAFDRGGIRFGFFAAAWGVNDPDALRRSRFGVNPLAAAFAALRRMVRAGVEFRVVSLHWGHEFEYYPTAEQIHFARALVDAGADVVMGHHPHVLQPMAVYDAADGRRGAVFYSLGNFTTAMFTHGCSVGVVQGIEVYRDPSGAVAWSRPTRHWTRCRRGRIAAVPSPGAWLLQHLGEPT